MLGWLLRLFGHPSFQVGLLDDPILGQLRLAEDGDWWEAGLMIAGKKIRFEIGGKDVPDKNLIAHAHEIVGSFAGFDASVNEFLLAESHRYKRFAEEIQQLTIDSICLFWSDRADDGMIFFNSPNNSERLWRCDYINRQPTNLGFDS